MNENDSPDAASAAGAAPEAKSRYRFVNAAVRFAGYYGRPLVYWRSTYWEYTGTNYQEAGTRDYMQNLIDKWHQDVVPATGLDITDYTTDQIEGRLRSRVLLLHAQEMPATIGSDEKSLYTIGVENGLLDLEPCIAGGAPVLSRHDPSWFSTACLPYAYDSRATCPDWLRFLSTCLVDDVERIRLLQEWYGYCCTFDTSFEKALLMEGSGGNGKSQALEVLRLLVGKNNCSAVSLDKLGNRFDAVASLGKLVNISPETPAGSKVPVATLRHLITGEDFQFERKGIDTFTEKPTAKFVISMNQRPEFNDSSNALWRRLLLMPWTYEVPKPLIIRDLGRKIAARELPGIFNWAIEGLVRLHQQGHFTDSKAVIEATASLRAEGDPIHTYLTTRYQTGSGFVVRSVVWNALIRSRDQSEIVLPKDYTPSRLIQDIKRVFPTVTEKRRRVTNENPVFVWEGIQSR